MTLSKLATGLFVAAGMTFGVAVAHADVPAEAQAPAADAAAPADAAPAPAEAPKADAHHHGKHAHHGCHHKKDECKKGEKAKAHA